MVRCCSEGAGRMGSAASHKSRFQYRLHELTRCWEIADTCHVGHFISLSSLRDSPGFTSASAAQSQPQSPGSGDCTLRVRAGAGTYLPCWTRVLDSFWKLAWMKWQEGLHSLLILLHRGVRVMRINLACIRSNCELQFLIRAFTRSTNTLQACPPSARQWDRCWEALGLGGRCMYPWERRE